MKHTGRKLIVLGPRVLISPEFGEERTSAGLYLPPTVREKEEVQGGLVIET
ncbi:MAG: co-chaperone GroES, partial [Nitrospirae bacterium]